MRFLFVYTHQTWPMHYFQAGIMARALINEGHEVVWLNCDKTMTGCHVHWILPHVDPTKICDNCISKTGWIESMGIHPVSFLDFVTKSDVEAAMEPLDVQDLALLTNWTDCGTPVGRLALSSPASASRSISLSNPSEALYASYPVAVSSAIIVNRAVQRLLAKFTIDRAVFHLGRLVPDEVTKYHAIENGIPWYSYETGPITETLRLSKNETIYEYAFYTRSWHRLENHSLDSSQKNQVLDYLQNRRGDPSKTGLYTYSPTNEEGTDIYTLLDINRDQKIVSMFTSSIDEIAFIPYQNKWDSIYSNQGEIIKEFIEWARFNSEYTAIIRIHPNEGSKRNHLGMPGAKSVEAILHILNSSQLPSNVRIIWPDDEVSSYLIGDASAVVLVWQSTIGMELAASGKPVILLDNALYREADFCFMPSQRNELSKLIEKVQQCSTAELNARIDRAQAWVYHQDIRLSIEFPLIKDHGRWEKVSLTFDSPNSITTANFASLNKIVSYLTNDIWPYDD